MCSNWWHQEASWLCAAHQCTPGILRKARHRQTKNLNKTTCIVFVFTFLFGHVHVPSELKSHEHVHHTEFTGRLHALLESDIYENSGHDLNPKYIGEDNDPHD